MRNWPTSAWFGRLRENVVSRPGARVGLAASVLALGAVLRLTLLDLAPFAYDEADLVLRARAAAAGQLPLTGAQTSWGIPDPPLQVYLAAPLALLPSGAFATVVFFALLNTLTVGGLYFVVRRFFGQRVALTATLLFACNPWAIYFGRRAWLEDQPALTLLALWAALEVCVAGRPRFALLFFLSLAAGIQIRLLAVAFLPAAMFALLLGGRKWLSRWSAIGILAGALTSTPYLLYLLREREKVVAILGEGERGFDTPGSAVVQFTWWLISGQQLLAIPAGLSPWLDQLRLALGAEAWLAGALLVAGLAVAVTIVGCRASTWKSVVVLSAWVILPVLFIGAQRSTVYFHYLTLALPGIFVLPALAIDRLWSWRPAGCWLARITIVLVIVPQLATWIGLQRVLLYFDPSEAVEASLRERRIILELGRESAQVIGTGESYGVETPVRIWLAAGEAIGREMRAVERPLLVIAGGTDPRAEAGPAIVEAFLGSERPRYLDSRQLQLPLGQPGLLLITEDVDPVVPPERLGSRRTLIPLPALGKGSRDGIRLFDLPARDAVDLAQVSGARSQPMSGPAELAGLMLPTRPRAGEETEVVSLWRGPAENLQPSFMLSERSGQLLVEREASSRPQINLERDEALIVGHLFSLPNRVNGEFRVFFAGSGGELLQVGAFVVSAR